MSFRTNLEITAVWFCRNLSDWMIHKVVHFLHWRGILKVGDQKWQSHTRWKFLEDEQTEDGIWKPDFLTDEGPDSSFFTNKKPDLSAVV